MTGPTRAYPTKAVALIIERRIHRVRGEKVILDSDLAELYDVPAKAINQAVKRNRDRFPEDFMFQLTPAEARGLRSQSVTIKEGRGRHAKYVPHAFTEHGVAMLSSVLRSKRAVQLNVMIIRAFIRMREALAGYKDLAERVVRVEGTPKRHASVLRALVEEIENTKRLPEPTKRRYGFLADRK